MIFTLRPNIAPVGRQTEMKIKTRSRLAATGLLRDGTAAIIGQFFCPPEVEGRNKSPRIELRPRA